MDRTPNKRKSLAKGNKTPTKIQKTAGTPVPQMKNNKSPKFNNKQNSPQKKQTNGKQNTPKGNIKPKQTEEDEAELFDDSEDESDISIEQAQTIETAGDSDSEENSEDSDEDDDESETKTAVKKPKSIINPEDRKYSVFVGSLKYSTTEDKLRAHFEDCDVLSVMILRRGATLKSTGSAFVNFKDESSVQKALLKDNSKLDGYNIKVCLPLKGNSKLQLKRNKLKILQNKVKLLEKEIREASNSKQPKKIKFIKKKNDNKKAVKQE